jgi:hypothetical protein
VAAARLHEKAMMVMTMMRTTIMTQVRMTRVFETVFSGGIGLSLSTAEVSD